MKWNAKKGETDHAIEILNEGDKTFAVIDGKKREVSVSEPEPGIFLFKNDNRIFEVFVEQKQGGGSYAVSVDSELYEIELSDPKRLRSSAGSAHSNEGFVEIKSAMPGKVVRINVSEGDRVSAGEGVVVVEAMKMQNELKSPKDGVVLDIRVKEDQRVNAGDILAVIE